MASSIPDQTSSLRLQSLSPQPRFLFGRCSGPLKIQPFRVDSWRLAFGSGSVGLNRRLATRASVGSDGAGDGGVGWKGKGKVAVEVVVDRLQETLGVIPPMALRIKRNTGSNFVIGFLSIASSILVILVRQIAVREAKQVHKGSVADLVKRGQLRSDRSGISKPLKYEDPFNNPLVKRGKGDSTMEICGKVFRLAPVMLTEEQQSSHQKRRSRAYNWKRPSIFLKEGDDIPPDVDPDTIRWIPANHPFATTVSDIDENMAQSNVNQKDGVPFRIRTEHEALQRKLEALQSEQKLNKMAISPNSFRDFETPLNSQKRKEQQDTKTSVDEKYDHQNPTSKGLDPCGSNDHSSSDE